MDDTSNPGLALLFLPKIPWRSSVVAAGDGGLDFAGKDSVWCVCLTPDEVVFLFLMVARR